MRKAERFIRALPRTAPPEAQQVIEDGDAEMETVDELSHIFKDHGGDGTNVSVPEDQQDEEMAEEIAMPPVLALPSLHITPVKRKENVLGDVPLDFKESKYQDEPSGIEQLPALVMMVTQQDESGWMTKQEKEGMSTLLNKTVTGVRVHAVPRRTAYDHSSAAQERRLPVMMTETGSLNLADEDVDRQCKKMPGE